MKKNILLIISLCALSGTLQAVNVYLTSNLPDKLKIRVNGTHLMDGSEIKELHPCCCEQIVRVVPGEVPKEATEYCHARCKSAKLGNFEEITAIEVEYGEGTMPNVVVIPLDDARRLYESKIKPQIDKDARIADYYNIHITIDNRYSPEYEAKIINFAKGTAVGAASAISSYGLIYGCYFLGYDASMLQTILGTGLGAMVGPYIIKTARKKISKEAGERICQMLPIGKTIATFIHNLNPWSIKTDFSIDASWYALKMSETAAAATQAVGEYISAGAGAVSSALTSAVGYVPYIGSWYCSEPVAITATSIETAPNEKEKQE